MDFVVGCELLDLIQVYKEKFQEEEARDILKGMMNAVASLNHPSRKIAHRDIGIRNIMIHFTNLEPNQNDMLDPVSYMKNIKERIADLVTNLVAIRGQYKVKIIDYGFSKIMTSDIQLNGFTSKFGVLSTKAPEVEFDADVQYDERIDVWGIGVAFFILVTCRPMFPQKQTTKSGGSKFKKTSWAICLYNDIEPDQNFKHYSLSSVKFINDLVRYDFKERPTIFEAL